MRNTELIINWLEIALYPEHFYIAPSKDELQWGPDLLFPPSGRKVSPLLGIELVPTGWCLGVEMQPPAASPASIPRMCSGTWHWSAYAYNRRKEPHVLLWRTTACNVCIPLLLSEVWSLYSLHNIQPWSTPLQQGRTTEELHVFRDPQLHGTVTAETASLWSMRKQRDSAWNKSPFKPGLVHNWKFLHPQEVSKCQSHKRACTNCLVLLHGWEERWSHCGHARPLCSQFCW